MAIQLTISPIREAGNSVFHTKLQTNQEPNPSIIEAIQPMVFAFFQYNPTVNGTKVYKAKS
jgi:hypothetical protein